MIANRYLLMHKFIRVIEAYAEETKTSLREALDNFYNSDLFIEMNEGISDMHCRSDGYLSEELSLEMKKKAGKPPRASRELCE
jgi:hypothetical protein